MRQLEYCAGARFGVKPGMCRLAIDRKCETTDSLALGLEATFVAQRGFKYEGAIGQSREPPYITRRRAASNLFVSVNKNQRQYAWFEIEVAQRLDGENELRKAAFHVEDARAPDNVAIYLKGSIIYRTNGPDSIVVADDELRYGVLAAFFRARIYMIAGRQPGPVSAA